MKVLFINCDCGCYSTGRIVSDIASKLIKSGNEVLACYGRDYKETGVPTYKIGTKVGVFFHALLSRIFDSCGLHSKHATKKLIKKIIEFSPDLIHLHNLHGYYINYRLLFKFLKEYNRPIVWTLHDCWAFTGHCAYFDFAECKKWKHNCSKCPQKHSYPKSFLFDMSARNFLMKKDAFLGVSNMTIVTPSKWLADLVKQSFLKEYKVQVINNGVDTNVFKKNYKAEFKTKNNLLSKKIILGVASPWSKRKGFDDFLALSSFISDEYSVVMIGIDKKQSKQLPNNVIGIKKTTNINELVDIYSSSYVLLNTTYEDNYPTVNLEAQACGCPVISYETGGSVESCVPSQIVSKKAYRNILTILESGALSLCNISYDIDTMTNNYFALFCSSLGDRE